MNTAKKLCFAAILAAALLLSANSGTPAQGSGAIEVTAFAAPSGGRPEPALRLPIFLLRKSFAEIQREAEKENPPADLSAFVDALEVSPELKDWMKKKKTARLSGTDFINQLSAGDILNVPEFWEAYLTRNGQDVNVGFPRAKFKVNDRDKDPARYDQEREEFRNRVRKHLQSYAHTKEGMDMHLTPIDPGHRWMQKEGERRAEVHRRGLQLAQTTYLVAKGETDLQGRGGFVRVTPGEFYLSTLEHEAIAGDVRLRWDLPVAVRAGETTRIELSNVNSLPRVRK